MCVCVCIVYIYLLLWVSEYHLVIFLKTDSSRKPADCLFTKPSICNVVRRPALLTQNSYPPAASWRLDLVLHTCNYQLCTGHSDWEPGESEFENNLGYMVNPCLKKSTPLRLCRSNMDNEGITVLLTCIWRTPLMSPRSPS